MYIACFFNRGFEEVSRILLRKGSDKNALNDKKRSPLHYAARSRHINLVHILLENEAEVDQQVSFQFNYLF